MMNILVWKEYLYFNWEALLKRTKQNCVVEIKRKKKRKFFPWVGHALDWFENKLCRHEAINQKETLWVENKISIGHFLFFSIKIETNTFEPTSTNQSNWKRKDLIYFYNKLIDYKTNISMCYFLDKWRSTTSGLRFSISNIQQVSSFCSLLKIDDFLRRTIQWLKVKQIHIRFSQWSYS